jgi:hypothetical protein
MPMRDPLPSSIHLARSRGAHAATRTLFLAVSTPEFAAVLTFATIGLVASLYFAALVPSGASIIALSM